MYGGGWVAEVTVAHDDGERIEDYLRSEQLLVQLRRTRAEVKRDYAHLQRQHEVLNATGDNAATSLEWWRAERQAARCTERIHRGLLWIERTDGVLRQRLMNADFETREAPKCVGACLGALHRNHPPTATAACTAPAVSLEGLRVPCVAGRCVAMDDSWHAPFPSGFRPSLSSSTASRGSAVSTTMPARARCLAGARWSPRCDSGGRTASLSPRRRRRRA